MFNVVCFGKVAAGLSGLSSVIQCALVWEVSRFEELLVDVAQGMRSESLRDPPLPLG